MPSLTSGSLERLLSRRDGSRSALGSLLEHYRPWLKRRVEARLPKKVARRQDASDLVQECQTLASVNVPKFRGESPAQFRAWLTGILDNRILRALRFWGEPRRNLNRDSPLAPDWDRDEELGGSSISLLERFCREEDRGRLAYILGLCREDDQTIIMLRHLEDQSHEEIAARLGIAEEAARKRYSRAIGKARDIARLIARMEERGFRGRQQEVVILYRIKGVPPAQIVDQLGLTRDLVAAWIKEAEPVLREFEEH